MLVLNTQWKHRIDASKKMLVFGTVFQIQERKQVKIFRVFFRCFEAVEDVRSKRDSPRASWYTVSPPVKTDTNVRSQVDRRVGKTAKSAKTHSSKSIHPVSSIQHIHHKKAVTTPAIAHPELGHHQSSQL